MLDTDSLSSPVPASQSHEVQNTPIILGMIGLGTVGSGVYKILSQRSDLSFRKIAVHSLGKDRNLPELDRSILTDSPKSVVSDPAIQVIIEVMGGVDEAKPVVIEALKSGKHVITANKELIAKHGAELFELAKSHNVRLMFEAAVAAGIPIITPLKLSLAANNIQEIAGILNGTTNYMLTKMTEEGWDYEEALEQAQKLGFAEADPSSDVEGNDAAYKISILASIAFKKRIEMKHVYCKGITSITAEDIKLAESLGYTIKLLGLCRQADAGQLDVRVHPVLVEHAHPLANIKNENNAIWIKGDAVGDVMFYGKGAGEMPTASAVCADLLAITTDLQKGNDPIPSMEIDYTGLANVLPITETENKYFVRLETADHPGVIGLIGTACGEFGVSLESIVQHGIHETSGSASIVFVTHKLAEQQVLKALDKIKSDSAIQKISCVLRIL